jgi:hypothetical protein
MWSIGLACGPSLDKLVAESTPIVSCKTLKECGGIGAADPFAIQRNGVWYLFFEMFRPNSTRAVIGAASSRDLQHWDMIGNVLEPAHHLSYPFVFEHEGEMYMMPESKPVRRVDLYRAIDFPSRWAFDRTLLRGRFMDCSIVRHENLYWMFAGWHSYWLKLFYASSPLGPWKRHWMPMIRNYSKSSTRPGGRPIHWNDQLIRFSQDNTEYYGQQLRAWTVTKMNRLWYSDKPYCDRPILQGTGNESDWNGRCMHHIDPFVLDSHSTPATTNGADRLVAFTDGRPTR